MSRVNVKAIVAIVIAALLSMTMPALAANDARLLACGF